MSFETDTVSYMDLKEQAKRQLHSAKQVERTISLTERNWNSLIACHSNQLQMLAEVWERLNTLMTEEDMRRHLHLLMKEYEEQRQKANEILTLMQEETKEFSKQAGRLREQNSSNLSQQKEQMKRFTKRQFLIGLTPTILFLVWELISCIWPQIFLR